MKGVVLAIGLDVQLVDDDRGFAEDLVHVVHIVPHEALEVPIHVLIFEEDIGIEVIQQSISRPRLRDEVHDLLLLPMTIVVIGSAIRCEVKQSLSSHWIGGIGIVLSRLRWNDEELVHRLPFGTSSD